MFHIRMKLTTVLCTLFWMLSAMMESRKIMAVERVTAFHHDVMNEIVTKLNWTSAAIIQDTDNEMTLPKSVQQIRYNIKRFQVPKGLNILHEIMFPEIHIVVLLKANLLPLVLKQINDYDNVSGGVTDFRHHSKILACIASFGDVTTIEHLVQSLENIAVVICDHTNNGNEFQSDMLTLYNHPGGRIFSKVTGLRNINSTFTSIIFPNTQYGYNNRHLIVSTLTSTQYCRKVNVNGTLIYDGYVFDIWRSMAAVLNFSFDVTEPADGNWGVELENGTWTGFVEQLRKREVDVVLADLSVTHARTQHVDYIYPPIKVEDSDIIYKRKLASSKSFVKILKPLTPSVYLSVMAVLCGMLVMYILVEQSWFISRTLLCEGLPTAFVKHVPDVGWDFLGSSLKQGFRGSTMPKTNAGKFLLASWCLLVLIVTAVYSANLIASLSNATSTNKISSIEELVKSDYLVGLFTGGLSFVTVQTSPRPEIQLLYQKMLKLNQTHEGIFSQNSTRLRERAREGNFAIPVYTSEGEAMKRENCLLDLVGETVNWAAEELAFAVIKHSPLKADIENIMTQLQESGMLHIWWKKWNPDGLGCEVERSVQPVSLEDIGGGFLIVCGGLILSLGVLAMEVIYKSTQKTPTTINSRR